MNVYGLIIMAIFMIPNVIYVIKEKNFEGKYHNKVVEIIEQIGRFGSMGLMIFNIPILEFGYWFDAGKIVYMALTGVLAVLYCFVWFLYFKKSTMKNVMSLAIIPTIIFLSSGIIQGKILLIVLAILFGIGHIIITFNNNR
jgi:hypothetical protein